MKRQREKEGRKNGDMKYDGKREFDETSGKQRGKQDSGKISEVWSSGEERRKVQVFGDDASQERWDRHRESNSSGQKSRR